MTLSAAWPIVLLLALVVIAALVNRFTPSFRPRLPRVVILYVLYAIAWGVARVVAGLDSPLWAGRVDLAAELMRALLLVNLGGLVVFTLLLRTIGVVLPMIASDLLVGIAYVIATVGVFSEHGLDPEGAIATGAVASAVLAISLQSTLGNILGGVALQLDGSIHTDRWIRLGDGTMGRIGAIRWRHTLVQTRDGGTVVVPNAELLGSKFTVLGERHDEPQRMTIELDVDYRFAPGRVIREIENALAAAPIEHMAHEPAPTCVCTALAKDCCVFAVRYWVTDLAHEERTSSRVRARIYSALRRAGIQLGVPAIADHVETYNREQTLAAIKDVHLFQTLSQAELEQLAAGMKHLVFSSGETIAWQGAPARGLYIITAGSVEIRTRVDGGLSRRVAVLEGPDVFGEMGLMTGEPRVADVIAQSDVECFRLDRPVFERVLLARPEIAGELAETLASRKVGLDAAREGLGEEATRLRQDRERERILGGIKTFFGL